MLFRSLQGTFAVSSYTSGFAGMIEEFGTTPEVLAVGQFTFLIGIGALRPDSMLSRLP